MPGKLSCLLLAWAFVSIDAAAYGEDASTEIVPIRRFDGAQITVIFKPDADADTAQQELASIGVALPRVALCAHEVALMTPHRDQNTAMKFVTALEQNDKVSKVDNNNNDSSFAVVGEHIMQDTSYLRVQFKKPMSIPQEQEWLKRNFPELRDAGLESVDQQNIKVVTSKDGNDSVPCHTYTFPNFWYRKGIFSFTVADTEDMKNAIAKLDQIKSLPVVKSATVQPLYSALAPREPPESSDYFIKLAHQIKRAWYPPHHGTWEPMTVRLVVDPNGRITRMRFVELANAAIHNAAARNAITNAFCDKGVDYKACLKGENIQGAIELDVLFFHSFRQGYPLSSWWRPIIVRRVSSPDDSSAAGWSNPCEPHSW